MNKSEKKAKRLTKRDQPKPVNEKIDIPEDYVLISKTDPKGIIIEGNQKFEEISGYTLDELKGSSHNVIRHPDMPKVLFKLVWDRIMDKENIMAIIKNLAKDGRAYWVITDFVTKVSVDREVIDYTAYRKPVCDEVIDAILPMYNALNAIEEFAGMGDAEEFLNRYFEKHQTNYDDFIEALLIENCKQKEMVKLRKQNKEKELTRNEKKSFFKRFFGAGS